MSTYLKGTCPDSTCEARLIFPQHSTSIECPECGQRHEQKDIQSIVPITDVNSIIHNVLKELLIGSHQARKGPEMVKVLGLNNYHCRLLSPLLTRYGLDKRDGLAKPLSQLNQKEPFDCSILCDRAFLIQQQHINIPGYGRDISGSATYLADTLSAVASFNDQQEHLLPIHAEGDGHCLVHAVSRALVGREFFWHALRCNLKRHFTENLEKYTRVFCDFIDAVEWNLIIDECDPEYRPADNELLGLRNIHVFGLANVLKRPIILLDSTEGMNSPGDYSGVFLPAFNTPDACKGRSGELNKPLCLAWSSKARMHYIPLVGIKGESLPSLPRRFLPKVWGIPQDMLPHYIDFDINEKCIVGGDKCLQDSYINKLVTSMDDLFYNQNQVHPALVADVQQHLYRRCGVIGVKPSSVIEFTQKAVLEQRLYRCINCDAVVEKRWNPDWLKPGGDLYELCKSRFTTLKTEKYYSFTTYSLLCHYDEELDELIPDPERSEIINGCMWCSSNKLRQLKGDNALCYENGDKTKSKSNTSLCICGFKHWWNGKEYDNLPQQIPVSFTYGGVAVSESVSWFQYESDRMLNSNVFDVAANIVHKHFPGTFGSELLVQTVVDQLLERTKKPELAPPPQDTTTMECTATEKSNEHLENFTSVAPPSKMIIPGLKMLHKEELGVSDVERRIKAQLQEHSSREQSRASSVEDQRKRRHADKSPKTPSVNIITSSPVEKKTTRIDEINVSEDEKMEKREEPRHTEQKVFRVVTSDGRQCQLNASSTMTYSDLLDLLLIHLNIPQVSIVRILHGFPPREIIPPANPEEDSPLTLQGGDRIQVSLHTVPTESQPQKRQPVPKPTEITTPVDTASAIQQLQSEVLSGLEQLHTVKGEETLDTTLSSLILTLKFLGMDVWEYVQKHPRLFLREGLFYQQMARDVGLINGKHCELPAFPKKKFCYNAEHDRVELCLEPKAGHVPIGQPQNESEENKTVMPINQHSNSAKQAFSGQGYVLSSSSSDVVKSEDSDVPMSDEVKPIEVQTLSENEDVPMASPLPPTDDSDRGIHDKGTV